MHFVTKNEVRILKNVTNNRISAKRATVLAVLSALGLVSFVVENMFPPLLLPGAKLGLGNAFSLFALFALGPVDGLIVAVVRSVLGSLIVGNMSTLVYSLAAGVVATSLSAVCLPEGQDRCGVSVRCGGAQLGAKRGVLRGVGHARNLRLHALPCACRCAVRRYRGRCGLVDFA